MKQECKEKPPRPLCPPHEGPFDPCMKSIQKCAYYWRLAEAAAVSLFIVIFSLAVYGVLRPNHDLLSVVSGLAIHARPEAWYWTLHILLFIWFAAGIANAISTIYRSAVIEYVLRPGFDLVVALVLWSTGLGLWVYEYLLIGTLVIALASVFLHIAVYRLMLGETIPTWMVFLFWINGHAFAAGFSWFTVIFALDAALEYHLGLSVTASTLVFAFTCLWAIYFGINMISPEYLLPITIGMGSAISRMHSIDVLHKPMGIAAIMGLVGLGLAFLYSVYFRYLSTKVIHSRGLFINGHYSMHKTV